MWKKDAHADLDVANATIKRRNTTLLAARKETKKLRYSFVGINVEVGAVSSLRRDSDKLHNDLKDKDTDITCPWELFIAVRDTAFGGLPSSKNFFLVLKK